MPAAKPTLFLTTRWTLVGKAVASGDTEARKALDDLFRIYWKPLYRYVRRTGKSPEDAEDLVQGFFGLLVTGDGLRLADRERGRFRAFLLAAVKNFMVSEWRREHRQKRGGFAAHLSLDWQDAETGLKLEVEDTRSPDRLFDREWAMTLLEKVLDDLEREEPDFARWKPFLSMSRERLPCADMAQQLGMSEGAARRSPMGNRSRIPVRRENRVFPVHRTTHRHPMPQPARQEKAGRPMAGGAFLVVQKNTLRIDPDARQTHGSQAVDRPLTALFIDCDSFFASVEQHLDPRLRGKPVGVAPVMAETSCCIAASYEAKAFGVKTGTRISDARIMCPEIAIVESKPSEYIKIHHRIIEAVEDCIHVEAVLSIDEMWAWLPLNWREPDCVREIGRKIKATVAREVSPVIKVSVGAGPNKYLAKMASKMRKPDGLFLIETTELPEILYENKLRDFTGIARSMEARLHAAGIYTTENLCQAKKQVLHGVWGGVMGDRLWHLLRGDEIPDLVSARKTIGHSHVLPPDSRHPDRAWPILCKLLHKACERLRSHGLLAGSLTMQIAFFRGVAWAPEIRFPETDATIFLMRMLDRLWKDRPEPRAPILQLGIVLTRLCERGNFTPELFQIQVANAMASGEEKQQRLDATLDKLRARYGRSVVYFGGVHDARENAPMRISFTHIPDPELEQ